MKSARVRVRSVHRGDKRWASLCSIILQDHPAEITLDIPDILGSNTGFVYGLPTLAYSA